MRTDTLRIYHLYFKCKEYMAKKDKRFCVRQTLMESY